MKSLPQHPLSRMQHYQAQRHQMKLQVGKLMNFINLDFYQELTETRFHLTTLEFSTITKHLPQHPRTHVKHYRAHRRQIRLQV